MRTETQIVILLFLIAILPLINLILQSIRLGFWLPKPAEEKKPRIAKPLKPKTSDDCLFCQAEKACPPKEPQTRQMPRPWSEVRNRRGRKKGISTQGYACNNRKCDYYRVMDEKMHALVGYGHHGKAERIQDLICQSCGKKFSVRRDTVLYRLKSHSEKVALALALLAEGMDVSALERVTGIREGTLRTWLSRAGMHAEKMHTRFFQELIYGHIQLDELWANFDHKGKEVWLWVATEAKSKLIPVIELGPRTLDMAMGVMHALVGTMRPSCLPIFTTDGLKLYFYALTAHFGQWKKSADEEKPIWEVAAELLYGQVKKTVRRRRLVKVEHMMLWGELENLKAGLKKIGLSGQINTSFVERLNLTIRQGVSLLVRRTWGRAKYSPELKLHLLWWRGYYHFARYHAALRVKLSQPTERKGKQIPCKYRSRTPAMVAGLATRRWSVIELISYPLA
jgi:IS1 family transposase